MKLSFGSTTCVIGPSWVVTTLPGGYTVHAHPQNTPQQARTALDLGYGHDTVAMTLDHDTLHAWLAHTLGQPHSESLMSAARDYHGVIDYDLAALEEEAVLALQALCRKLGRMPWQSE